MGVGGLNIFVDFSDKVSEKSRKGFQYLLTHLEMLWY